MRNLRAVIGAQEFFFSLIKKFITFSLARTFRIYAGPFSANVLKIISMQKKLLRSRGNEKLNFLHCCPTCPTLTSRLDDRVANEHTPAVIQFGFLQKTRFKSNKYN